MVWSSLRSWQNPAHVKGLEGILAGRVGPAHIKKPRAAQPAAGHVHFGRGRRLRDRGRQGFARVWSSSC